MEADPDLIQRARVRLVTQEVLAQVNIEAIADKAAEQIASSVSDDPVSGEWRDRFFRYAADVSSESMQTLWASVLAGEIARPKSYSVRTLDALYSLSAEEAALFAKLAPCCTKSGLAFVGDFNQAFSLAGINYADVMTLRSAGLLGYEENTQLPFPADQSLTLSTSEFAMGITPQEGDKALPSVRLMPFTSVGRELYSLHKPRPNYVHFQRIGAHYHRLGATVIFIGGDREEIQRAHEQAARFGADTPNLSS